MRRLKVAGLRVARALGLFRLARRITQRGVRVLCYHGVWMGDPRFRGDCMFIRADTFARRLDHLRSLGYPVVSLDRAMHALRHGEPLPPCATVITIDDGWYGTHAHMAPALEARGLPATLYCDTAQLLAGAPIWHVMANYLHATCGRPALDPAQRALLDQATNLGDTPEAREQATRLLGQSLGLDVEALLSARAFSYMTPDEMREIIGRGVVDVQLHTHRHTLHDLSEAAVEQEVAQNAEVLTRLFGGPSDRFRHFCYPSGILNASAAMTLHDLGMASSTTCRPGLAFPGSDLQRVPRFLDGDTVDEVELEAELSGFLHLVRTRGMGWRAGRAGMQTAQSDTVVERPVRQAA